MTTALLFEKDRVDEIDDWPRSQPRIGRSAILWIDLERPSEDELAGLVDALGLSQATARRLAGAERVPRLEDHREYLHVTVVGLTNAEDRTLVAVDCLVAPRWLVTVRDQPLELVDRFRERTEGSGAVGMLDGLGFLASLLEWALASYLDAFERLEQDLEELDAKAMSGRLASVDEVLPELVSMRREVGRLRRALVAHREVLLALTHPELEEMVSRESAERFTALRDRLEEALQASRDTRESIVGSFDVLLATTGQRTNEIMKVLTLASVLLLPGALVAGIMGMNFELGIFDTEAYFWVVLAVIAGIAGATLALARARRWI
ncbi:MAG TPA: CorA family divalent cation transporter [Gaiellaceae bacterium]|nr:CorA family divalent cation transporter [Gaiellaceae bacterium]